MSVQKKTASKYFININMLLVPHLGSWHLEQELYLEELSMLSDLDDTSETRFLASLQTAKLMFVEWKSNTYWHWNI